MRPQTAGAIDSVNRMLTNGTANSYVSVTVIITSMTESIANLKQAIIETAQPDI